MINDISNCSYFSNLSVIKLDVQKSNLSSFCCNNDTSEDSSCETVEETDGIAVIAHRGYSSEAPENTIPAIILAAENGYDTVECDINWTKDSVPVLLHDDTINRTSRTKGGWKYIFKRKCSNYTYEELQKFDFGSWKGKEYEGTKIPSFAQTLECCNEYDLNLYVEIKDSDNFDLEKAQILAETVKEAGMEDKVTWISFNPDYLKMISELMPEARLGYLTKKEPNEKTIKILEELQTENNEVFLDVKASKMTDEADKLLDDAGFDFEAWTVDDEETLEKMYSYDCQGITTNKLTEDSVDDFLDEYNK